MQTKRTYGGGGRPDVLCALCAPLHAPQVAELRKRTESVPDEYFVVLVGDMITEEVRAVMLCRESVKGHGTLAGEQRLLARRLRLGWYVVVLVGDVVTEEVRAGQG